MDLKREAKIQCLWGKEARVFLTLLIGITALLGYRTIRAKTSAASKITFGRYTAAQIIDRSEQLCRTITSRDDRLVFFADTDQAYAPNGALQRHWRVDCKNEAGEVIVHLLWDADTGDLCTAAQLLPQMSGRKPPKMPAGMAVRRAAEWMRTLGIAATAPRWRLTGKPSQCNMNWNVQWQAQGRSAFIVLNAGTGDLTLAASFPASAHTARPVSSHPCPPIPHHLTPIMAEL